ncbi:ATP-binding protein [Sporosarcina sp. ITBMC105]
MSDLEKTRKNLSFLVDDSLRPGLILHMDGNVLYENEAFKLSFDSVTNQNIVQLLDASSYEAFEKFTRKAKRSGCMMMETMPKKVMFTEKHPVDMQLLFVPDVNKMIVMFDAVHLQMLPSMKTYVNAFNQSSNFILLVDQEGIIRDVNAMHTVFINRSREDLIGENISTVLSIIDSRNTNDFAEICEAVKRQGCVETFKSYQRTQEDTRHYHITTYYDQETNMYIIQMADSTEKENLQVQLAHSGSLSAVGQIAASIAHEIRNPITTLKGFTQLLKASASDDSKRYISVIEDEIDRMESILGEMLVLSKPSVKKKSIFSLEILVDEMVGVLQPKALMEGIEIDTDIRVKESPLLYGDPDKFKQVLLNLFKNALESMEHGGILTIQLSEEDKKIMLTIKDTGKGMTLHQVNQIFMPFFSSKPGGTGLGLPFVLKTVEEHGGTIAVESQLEIGTKFVLTLPKKNEAANEMMNCKRTIVS